MSFPGICSNWCIFSRSACFFLRRFTCEFSLYISFFSSDIGDLIILYLLKSGAGLATPLRSSSINCHLNSTLNVLGFLRLNKLLFIYPVNRVTTLNHFVQFQGFTPKPIKGICNLTPYAYLSSLVERLHILGALLKRTMTYKPTRQPNL